MRTVSISNFFTVDNHHHTYIKYKNTGNTFLSTWSNPKSERKRSNRPLVLLFKPNCAKPFMVLSQHGLGGWSLVCTQSLSLTELSIHEWLRPCPVFYFIVTKSKLTVSPSPSVTVSLSVHACTNHQSDRKELRLSSSALYKSGRKWELRTYVRISSISSVAN